MDFAKSEKLITIDLPTHKSGYFLTKWVSQYIKIE